MNISRYMKKHEARVNVTLLSNSNSAALQKLATEHERIIMHMQHERLVHLIVTLAFGIFLLITIAIAFIKPVILVLVLSGLFFIMLIFYVAHYFFLENTIQRWYVLADRIADEIESAGV